jgi:hypothetical protein
MGKNTKSVRARTALLNTVAWCGSTWVRTSSRGHHSGAAAWLEALADWHAARTLQHPTSGFMGRRKILEQAVSHQYASDKRAS